MAFQRLLKYRSQYPTQLAMLIWGTRDYCSVKMKAEISLILDLAKGATTEMTHKSFMYAVVIFLKGNLYLYCHFGIKHMPLK